MKIESQIAEAATFESRGIIQMLGYGVRLKCPRCGIGALYAKLFRMHATCAHCGLKFEREQGYFIGAMYINYGATVGIAVLGFFLLDAFTGMNINQQLALWVPFAVIFPLLFFRHSRSLWLVLDHFFNPVQDYYGSRQETP
jgi:uncharacterized protein (DUF983 family)